MTRLLTLLALIVSASAASAQSVAVTLSEWKIQTPRDTLRPGPVTFEVKNAGSMTHGLYVRGEGVDKGTRDIAARESATLTVTLKPGTYEIFCPMSELSHKNAGMTRKLVVKADSSDGTVKHQATSSPHRTWWPAR